MKYLQILADWRKGKPGEGEELTREQIRTLKWYCLGVSACLRNVPCVYLQGKAETRCWVGSFLGLTSVEVLQSLWR